MGDIISDFMKKSKGKGTASEAKKLFSGLMGPPEWSDPPSKKIGDWWKGRFNDAVGKPTPHQKGLRDDLAALLNDWKPENRDQSDSIRRAFNDLIPTLKLADDKSEKFRSASYSTMLTVAAAYESELLLEFPEKLAFTRGAAEADRIFELVGEGRSDYQLPIDKDPAEWFSGNLFSVLEAKNTKLLQKVKDSLRELEKKPAKDGRYSEEERAARINAMQTLFKDFEDLQKAAKKQGGQELKDAVDVLFVEVLRKPLGTLRESQPVRGWARGLGAKDLDRMHRDAQDFRKERNRPLKEDEKEDKKEEKEEKEEK